MGRFALGAYVVITVGTMFIIQAAVTWVTAGLAEQLFQLGWSSFTWSAVLLACCVLLLWVGRYPALDISMKIIIFTLTICTLVAVLLALGAGTWGHVRTTEAPSYWHAAGIGFIIAFMGWMPIPLDVAHWHSIWAQARRKQTTYSPSVAEARFDFDMGYGIAALIGVLFFMLGALVMFGSGVSFAPQSVAFASQIVDLYSQTLGAWSAPLVSIAAFVAMFSTTLAVTDAYPRVLSEIAVTYRTPSDPQSVRVRMWVYRFGLILVPSLALVILSFMTGAFTGLVDFAAGLSFIAAPILGTLNLKAISGEQVPVAARPGPFYYWFSVVCLVFLYCFTGIWFYWTF